MRKKFLVAIFLLTVLSIVWFFYDFYQAAELTPPDFVSLSEILQKEEWNNADYALMTNQTGLGKRAIDELRQSENGIERILAFQQRKQEKLRYKQSFLFFPTTTAELLCDDEKTPVSLLLPPLHAGDVLITRSTKTLLYRHGHAGLLVNADETIESLMIGSRSMLLPVENWLFYPTIMVLRPKEELMEKGTEAAGFAKERLKNVPYSLFTGVLQKDKQKQNTIERTQCAHLVWQAYQGAGLEIDSDGGFLVTPKDIAASDAFDVVYSYGFGENGRW